MALTRISTLIKKELASYFNSPVAYICITVFLVTTNWLFFRFFFVENQAEMRYFFGVLPWIYLFFVPALTMRLWAEEKRAGTFEVLLTLPVKDYELVLGKFGASFLFLSLVLGLTFTIPATVAYLGNPDWGPIIGGYLGLLLVGGVYLSIGSFASSLTKNQIIAFILGVVFPFILLMLGDNLFLFSLPASLVPLFKYLGLGSHFESITKGVIDSRDIVYYCSLIFFFLYINIRSLESRYWK